jgi:hypothetical protein
MTPQEKAKDLYDSYWYCLLQSNIVKRDYWSQQCALIAVDEIINDWINKLKKLKDETIEIKHSLDEMMELSHSIKYWNEVKQEIEKL